MFAFNLEEIQHYSSLTPAIQPLLITLLPVPTPSSMLGFSNILRHLIKLNYLQNLCKIASQILSNSFLLGCSGKKQKGFAVKEHFNLLLNLPNSRGLILSGRALNILTTKRGNLSFFSLRLQQGMSTSSLLPQVWKHEGAANYCS